MPVHRLLAVLILASWMAPTVGIVAIGLHLALDHHSHHEAGQAHEFHDVSDLALAMFHGHHHDAEVTPKHQHDAILDGVSPLLRSSASLVATSPLVFSQESPPADRSGADRPPRRAQPLPLFTAHCSLLL